MPEAEQAALRFSRGAGQLEILPAELLRFRFDPVDLFAVQRKFPPEIRKFRKKGEGRLYGRGGTLWTQSRFTQEGAECFVAPAVPAAPARMLIHDKLYSVDSISNTVCRATVPLRGEIDFDLEEDASEGLYWTVSSYDANICRVEMKHDRGGIWPFRYDKAEIELKGVAPGTTTVVFTYPDGKTFSVLFTVR